MLLVPNYATFRIIVLHLATLGYRYKQCYQKVLFERYYFSGKRGCNHRQNVCNADVQSNQIFGYLNVYTIILFCLWVQHGATENIH